MNLGLKNEELFLQFIQRLLARTVRWISTRDACTRQGQGDEIFQKGARYTILIAYPGTDSTGDQWERYIFEILEFTKGTNIDALQYQAGSGQQHIM